MDTCTAALVLSSCTTNLNAAFVKFLWRWRLKRLLIMTMMRRLQLQQRTNTSQSGLKCIAMFLRKGCYVICLKFIALMQFMAVRNSQNVKILQSQLTNQRVHLHLCSAVATRLYYDKMPQHMSKLVPKALLWSSQSMTKCKVCCERCGGARTTTTSASISSPNQNPTKLAKSN